MNQSIKWILVVSWTAFIVYGLLSPSDGIPLFPWMDFEGFDKLVHLALFAVEAVLLMFALTSNRKLPVMALVLAFCVTLGGVLEIAQFYFIETRNGDFWDLLADSVGAVVGVGVAYFFINKWR